MSLETFSLTIPRNAFSLRDAARAGDLWRALQDAAVIGSVRRGWTPQRYAAEGCAFIVRKETVVHHREVRFGEDVRGTTWVERFRRGMFSTRQVRLEVDGAPLTSATQEWVHVSTADGMRVARASDDLIAAFAERPAEPLVELPAWELVAEGPEHGFGFTAWFTWMDPLNHANHPAYVDWCDEALSRVLHRAGLDPLDLVPVAEELTFRAGVVAPDEVSVALRLVGQTAAGDAVVRAVISRASGICAEATLVRRLVDGPGALVAALAGGAGWR